MVGTYAGVGSGACAVWWTDVARSCSGWLASVLGSEWRLCHEVGRALDAWAEQSCCWWMVHLGHAAGRALDAWVGQPCHASDGMLCDLGGEAGTHVRSGGQVATAFLSPTSFFYEGEECSGGD